jgi:hypothetical protein
MNPNAVGLDPESSFRKDCPMTMAPIPAVALIPVAYFRENYFLESLVVRADDSVLVTTVLQKELWYVPSAKPGTVVSPVLLHTFKHPILGIVEAEPDVWPAASPGSFRESTCPTALAARLPGSGSPTTPWPGIRTPRWRRRRSRASTASATARRPTTCTTPRPQKVFMRISAVLFDRELLGRRKI